VSIAVRVWSPSYRPIYRPHPPRARTWWGRFGDERYRVTLDNFVARPAVARTVWPAMTLGLAWPVALVAVDVTAPAVELDTPILRTYCGDTPYRSPKFVTPTRVLEFPVGSEAPCVLPPGRYTLTLSAATKSVLAYRRTS
jgi:hypothetical protein